MSTNRFILEDMASRMGNWKNPDTAARFVAGNILSRTIGVLPPYWHKVKTKISEAGEFEDEEMVTVRSVSDEYENEFLELSDAELVSLIRNNALGYPMIMPLEIELPDSGDMWLLPWEPVITLKGKNVITRRRAAKSEKRGTIKEHWTQDDYEINIQGMLMDYFDEHRYPREDVEKLRKIGEAKKDLQVNCVLLEIFGISRIVIEDFDIPFTKGENTQGYTLKAYSDDLFELLIDETTLKQK